MAMLKIADGPRPHERPCIVNLSNASFAASFWTMSQEISLFYYVVTNLLLHGLFVLYVVCNVFVTLAHQMMFLLKVFLKCCCQMTCWSFQFICVLQRFSYIWCCRIMSAWRDVFYWSADLFYKTLAFYQPSRVWGSSRRGETRVCCKNSHVLHAKWAQMWAAGRPGW